MNHLNARSTLIALAAASALAGGRSPVSAGTCQAPHTTAIRWCPSFRAARSTWRMYASRTRSSAIAGALSRTADRR